jgi:hypothetical protein
VFGYCKLTLFIHIQCSVKETIFDDDMMYVYTYRDEGDMSALYRRETFTVITP